MSGTSPFDVYAPERQPRERASEGSIDEAPDWLEGIGAALRVQRDEQDLVQDVRLAEAYRNLERQLLRAGVPRARLNSTRAMPAQALANGMGASPATTTGIDRDMLWAEVARLRRANPNALSALPNTREEFETFVLRRRGGRDRDQDIAARAGLLPGLIGEAAGAMTDPLNILTLPYGGGGRTLLSTFASEAIVGGLIEALQTPVNIRNRSDMGEDTTVTQALSDVALAGAGAGVLGTLPPALLRGVDAVRARVTPLDRQIARELRNAEIDPGAMFDVHDARGLFGDVSDIDMVEGLRALRGGELLPSEADAAQVIEREAEVDAVNPYAGMAGMAAHEDNLSEAISRVLQDLPPADYDARALAGVAMRSSDALPVQDLGAASPTGGAARDAFRQSIRRAESGGNDRARNRQGSSARGRYQFVEGTFVSYYSRVFGVSRAEAQRAWNADAAFDSSVQERLMDAYIGDSEAVLRRINQPVTAGNLYVLHFAGHDAGRRLLQAPPDARAADYFSAQAVRQNGNILTGSVSEAIAELHRRVGGRAASVSVNGRVDSGGADNAVAQLREEAFELSQAALAMPDFATLTATRFRPDEIDVDANLMQFKGGGDARGVTERLQGVETWNPVLAGRAIVWESIDGRRLIADGHQRLGLAQRIAAVDPNQRPMIDALVMRESDGWDAESVRTWAALKNIAEGSGTPVDAAKIFRSMGEDAAARYLPPRSALVRDAGGLARLGDDAFGAVINELVDPGHAAIVGRLIADPGEQKALVDLLIRLNPRTLGEADAVIRQGVAAGFTRETQEDMFGTLDSTVSLMIERARVFDRALAEMRKLRQVFSSAARNAATLDAAGNRIDAAASAREALDNETAIDLVARLAWRAGPVKDAIDRAAQRLAGGERISDITRTLVRDIRAIDVDELVRRGTEADSQMAPSGADAADGLFPDGAGRASDADGADHAASPVQGYSSEPDINDGGWPSIREIEEAGQTGFDIFDAPPLRGFDEPDASGPMTTIASAEHDLRLIADDPELPTFRIGDDEDTRDVRLGDLLDEFSRDAAAIEAAKKCL